MSKIAMNSVASLTKAWKRRGPTGSLLAATFLVAGCAGAPGPQVAQADAAPPDVDRVNDPAESVNRTIFAGNQFVDRNALQPVARGYEDYVPGAVRHGVHNFLGNLGEPEVAVNDVLQGNFGRAWTTTQRFAINTTAGGAGLFDVATDWDRPGHKADFGQTLGSWGVGPGPAVQLPLFGPSNVRDSVGKLAGLVMNPTSYIPGAAVADVGMASGGLGVVDGRADLLKTTDPLERSSLDYYATLRSVMAQRRVKAVQEARAGDVAAGPDDAIELSHAKAP